MVFDLLLAQCRLECLALTVDSIKHSYFVWLDPRVELFANNHGYLLRFFGLVCELQNLYLFSCFAMCGE